ncbi:MAG: DNA polymerase III subunit gamma/tau [Candidatus Saccharimonadales bacterium]
MGQALYRKYRSKNLGEIVGQEHITTTLERALKKGAISHAYLFTGPRGVGKTSIARILAHEINSLPYDEETHLDIIEIDAASNRRIDEIRDLRDKVNTAPVAAKYKVYIIDEVHMLTKEAFNALLKTLEEPPAHVIFILATTEAHKLPETIVSRTQRFSFRPAAHDVVVKHLLEIAKKEKISIDNDALELIAIHGDGSFRDSIGLLDQASNAEGKVTRSTVEQMLGLAPAEHIQNLLEALESSQAEPITTELAKLFEHGYEAAMVATQLSEQLRQKLLANNLHISGSSAMKLLKDLLDVPAARDPKRLLELVLLDQAVKNTQPAPKPTTPKQVKPSQQEQKPSPPEPEPKPAPKETIKRELDSDIESLWSETLTSIKKDHNTLYGIARMAQVEFDDQKLTLRFAFAFHKKRASEPKNRQIIAETLHEISGKAFEIVCEVDESLPAKPEPQAIQPEQPVENEAVSTISNIFGSAELLES